MPRVRPRTIITLTLNPSVDLVLAAPGFRAGAHTRGERIAEIPSGKGMNVSASLALLGESSIATGLLGEGELRMYERHCAGVCRGLVSPRFVPIEARTRTTLTVLDPHGADTHLREAGPRVEPGAVRALERRLAALVRRGSILALCGSAPPGVTAPAIARIVRAARSKGAFVAVDTSGGALRAACLAGFTLLKVNAEEIAALTGRMVASAGAAAEASRLALALSRGAMSAVVVTLGARGATLVVRDQPDALLARCAVPLRKVRNTVGCGDALLAGMLVVLRRDPGAWERALLRGVACGAAKAMDPLTGSLDPRAARRLERAVEISAV